MQSVSRKGYRLWFVAAGLFAVAAVRDAFFPHFFSLGNGDASGSAGLAVVFFIIAMGLRTRSRGAAS
jgi:hypothetical protein